MVCTELADVGMGLPHVSEADAMRQRADALHDPLLLGAALSSLPPVDSAADFVAHAAAQVPYVPAALPALLAVPAAASEQPDIGRPAKRKKRPRIFSRAPAPCPEPVRSCCHSLAQEREVTCGCVDCRAAVGSSRIASACSVTARYGSLRAVSWCAHMEARSCMRVHPFRVRGPSATKRSTRKRAWWTTWRCTPARTAPPNRCDKTGE